MNEAPLLLSVLEASRQLGLGRGSTYELVRSGRLRSIRVGRKVLIPRAELSAFVERELGSDEGVMRD